MKLKQSIFIIGMLLIFSLPVYDYIKNNPESSAVLKQLQEESSFINPPPTCILKETHSSHKPRVASFEKLYNTNMSFSEVRAFYDKELLKNGWVFKNEKSDFIWMIDYGGRSAKYCKGSHAAILSYNGNDRSHKWDYSFSLSWGLEAIFDKYRCQ